MQATAFNPSMMLRQRNGKYSAYDMAQFIFWSDEESVAKAVEELIDENLMSRENAIEFLNDVRVGIDYLENVYSLKDGDTKDNVRCNFSLLFCVFLYTFKYLDTTTIYNTIKVYSNTDSWWFTLQQQL